MVRKYLLLVIFIFVTQIWYTDVTAQFFYKDIWSPVQLYKEMDILRSEKLKMISIKSFDTNGEASEGFFCEKRINKSYTATQTVTRSEVTSQSLLSSYFNSKGFIVKTSDSTESSLNITKYLYNDSDKIITVNTFTKAYDDPNAITESHQYIYNAGGQLKSMTRRKNNAAFSTINFKVDEKGNVIEEEEIYNNRKSAKYFYYYDAKNNLTDIVHFNERANRLLPDYMYEYNSGGQIKQMITIEEGGGYYIWRYTYNDLKLRETEKCFSKEKKLLGSVQYVYK